MIGKYINKYCELCASTCEQQYSIPDTSTIFTAYGSQRAVFCEEMFNSTSIPHMNPFKASSDLLFCGICHSIHKSSGVVVDISAYSLSVMFELGYAIGLNKPVMILADASAKNNYADLLDIIPQQFISFYKDDQDAIQFVQQFYGNSSISLFSRIMKSVGSHNRAPVCLFHHPACGALNTLIQRKLEEGLATHEITPVVALASVDNYRPSPLFDAVSKIIHSNGVVIPIVSPSFRPTKQVNAALPVYAGISIAASKTVVILTDDETKGIFSDLRGTLRTWSIDRELVHHLVSWIDSSAPILSEGLMGVKYAKGELASFIDFNIGSPDAEQDQGREISFYRSESVSRIISGDCFFVKGKRGVGKTATLRYILEHRYNSVKDPVIPFIPPRDLMNALVDIVSNEDLSAKPDYVLSFFWKEVIATIAIERCASLFETLSDRTQYQQDVIDYVSKNHKKRVFDIYTLCGNIIKKYIVDKGGISLYEHCVQAIDNEVVDLFYNLFEFTKPWILVDEIDRVWDVRSVTNASSLFISLIEYLHSIREQATITIFCRDDAFKLFEDEFYDRQHVIDIELEWSNEELVALIGTRIRDHFNISSGKNYIHAWNRIIETVEDFDAREYVVSRCMGRPRFLLKYLKNVLSLAKREERSSASSVHLRKALKKYSDELMSDLVKELHNVIPEIDKVLTKIIEFKVYGREHLNEVLREVSVENVKDTVSLLLEYKIIEEDEMNYSINLAFCD